MNGGKLGNYSGPLGAIRHVRPAYICEAMAQAPMAMAKIPADDVPVRVLTPGTRGQARRFGGYLRDERAHPGCEPPPVLFIAIRQTIPERVTAMGKPRLFARVRITLTAHS